MPVLLLLPLLVVLLAAAVFTGEKMAVGVSATRALLGERNALLLLGESSELLPVLLLHAVLYNRSYAMEHSLNACC